MNQDLIATSSCGLYVLTTAIPLQSSLLKMRVHRPSIRLSTKFPRYFEFSQDRKSIEIMITFCVVPSIDGWGLFKEHDYAIIYRHLIRVRWIINLKPLMILFVGRHQYVPHHRWSSVKAKTNLGSGVTKGRFLLDVDAVPRRSAVQHLKVSMWMQVL